MAVPERRHRRWVAATALGALACVAPALTGSAAAATVTQLQNKLNATQSYLTVTKSHEKTLAKSIASLNRQVSSLVGQINLVQAREAAASNRLTTENDHLSAAKAAIARERKHLAHLRRVLAQAQRALAAELVSEYEQPQQSVVSLVLDSGGFQQLLDGLEFLTQAKRQEQSVIVLTRKARAAAQAASARLAKLKQADARAASAASAESQALAGMGALLDSRDLALAHERAAQRTALAASREQGSKLAAAISSIQKQEAAADAATQTIISYSGGSLGASAGWAIPYAVVLCESGGQNLPPNSDGASGYYQIIPSTWREFGGSGPAAYLAPKSEQDAIAAKIWDGGAGAHDWTCSAIVGIT